MYTVCLNKQNVGTDLLNSFDKYRSTHAFNFLYSLPSRPNFLAISDRATKESVLQLLVRRADPLTRMNHGEGEGEMRAQKKRWLLWEWQQQQQQLVEKVGGEWKMMEE